MKKVVLASLITAFGLSGAATAAELNIYSARHYQTDEQLYGDFTRQTGIKINRIEAKEDELLERIRNEGANSPADIFITVNASRLAKADALGIFAPVKSETLEARIPDHLRAANWFSYSTRARVIVTTPTWSRPSRSRPTNSWPIRRSRARSARARAATPTTCRSARC